MGFTDSERMAMDALASRAREPYQIDPRDYGRLEQKVDALETEMHGLRGEVRELLALANKSRGGLWAGMSIVSALGGVIGWAAGSFLHR